MLSLVCFFFANKLALVILFLLGQYSTHHSSRFSLDFRFSLCTRRHAILDALKDGLPHLWDLFCSQNSTHVEIMAHFWMPIIATEVYI